MLERSSRTFQSHFRAYCAVIVVLLVMTGCSFLPPKPDNNEIWQAVEIYQALEVAPPEIIREGMQVPQRSFGRAGAVLWTTDKLIQRNYQIRFDQAKNEFKVISCETLKLGSDGVYRQSK